MWTDGGVAGRDVAHNGSWGAAPSIEFGLNTPTRLSLSYFHLGQDNVPDYGLPWVPANNEPLAALANQAAPVARSNYYGLAARDYERVNNDLGTMEFDHDFANGFSLRNLTRVRTDLSATLFFTDPGTYDGGELVVEDTYGVHAVKLPAGHLVLYPSTSLHHVRPVTRGARICSFFWIQSLVRDDGARTLLFDLDTAIQRVNQDTPAHPASVQLTGVYHNLLRRWAEL
jgi:hypothetical protein